MAQADCIGKRCQRHVAGALLLASTFTVGLPPGEAGAQTRDRAELVAGGGVSNSSSWYCYGCARRTYEVGGTLWWFRSWGISLRHEFMDGADAAVRARYYPASFFDVGFTNLMLRRRWFLGDALELDLGFGATVLHHHQGSVTGGVVPIEALVGRKFFRHFGIKAGYRHELLAGDTFTRRSRFVGFAVVGL